MSTVTPRAAEGVDRPILTVIQNDGGAANATGRDGVGAGTSIALPDRSAVPTTDGGLWTAPPQQVTIANIATRAEIIDVLVVVAAAMIAKVGYIDYVLGDSAPAMPYLLLGMVLATFVHLLYGQLELYEPAALKASTISFGKLTGGLLLAFFALVGVLFLLKAAEWVSRGWMLTWFMLSATGIVLARIGMISHMRSLVAEGRMRDRVALFGSLEFARRVSEHLSAKSPETDVVGIYCDDFEAGFERGSPRPDVEGGLRKLMSAAHAGLFDKILIVLPASEPGPIREAVRKLAMLPVELQLCTELAPSPVAVHRTDNVGDVRVDVVMPRPRAERARFVKAGLDYSIAAAALLAALPLFAVIALAIKLDSRGPVFFRQRRHGYNQRTFWVYKFRTMRTMEDGADVVQAQRGDPRVTRVGRFLRRSSLDEIPQLINVIKGDMSIVGPRPHALVHNEQFAALLEHYPWRHRVKPGITGWAQVNGFRGETVTYAQIEQRMKYDLYYIDNWSIWLDLEIIARTALALVTGKGAY